MTSKQQLKTQSAGKGNPASRGDRVGQWMQSPAGSVVTASVATMSTFGLVLSGIWAISLALP